MHLENTMNNEFLSNLLKIIYENFILQKKIELIFY